MFGHVISLNFDRKGDSHKTMIGGLFSLFIRLGIFCYVFLNFKRMLLNENDLNYTLIGIVDLEELGEVLYNETSLTIFHRIKKQNSPGWGEIDINDPEVQRYIDIKWVQQYRNYNPPKRQID